MLLELLGTCLDQASTEVKCMPQAFRALRARLRRLRYCTSLRLSQRLGADYWMELFTTTSSIHVVDGFDCILVVPKMYQACQLTCLP